MRAAPNPRVAVGSDWVDPRDVAGVSRGAGTHALSLTVHTFPPKRGVFRKAGRHGGRRVDKTIRFETMVDLIAARDRLRGECLPANSLWLDPSNDSKKLLIVVNPVAGDGKGKRVWEKDVQPVLRTAFDAPKRLDEEDGNKSRLDVLITNQRGDAFEACSTLDLDTYAAVVCVGGDGTVAEVRNGLLSSRDESNAALKIKQQQFPIGVVPTGSGNALAKSFSFITGTPCDATSAALAVAQGGWCPLDAADFSEVGSTESGDEENKDDTGDKIAMRSLLSFSWGLFADIDIESERFRWLGGVRFTAQAIVRILFPRKYSGCRLVFKPVNDDDESIDDDDVNINSNGDTAVRAAAKRALWKGIQGSQSLENDSKKDTSWRTLTDCECIRGVWALNVPWGAEDMHAAPGANTNDGAYDVIVIRATSRLQMLGLLLTFDSGGHTEHPAVTYLKCSEFCLTPGTSEDKKGGYLVVDGELVSSANGKSGKKRDTNLLPSNGGSTDNAATPTVGSPDSWSVKYGPTKIKVHRGGGRVFVAGAGSAKDAV